MKHERTPGAEWMLKFIKQMGHKAEIFLKAQTHALSRDSRQLPQERKHIGLVKSGSETYVREINDRCPLCREVSHLEECLQFLTMATVKRKSLIRTERRCFACLSRNHRIGDCNQKKRCGIHGCPGVHSRLLHHTRVAEGGRRIRE